MATLKKQTPLIVGNWKMNPGTLTAATSLFASVKKEASRIRGVEIAIAPPTPFLFALSEKNKRGTIMLGAQDIFFETSGAHTGEMSAPMLKSVGAAFAIVGHSEKRARGKSDEEIGRDLTAAVAGKLSVILCVGERARDEHGEYLSIVEQQLSAALADVPPRALSKIAIAYEPVWAIGTGNTASAADAHEMKLFIQKFLSDRFGRTVLNKVRILYGGSVTPQNATELLAEGQVDGFLVGGASLRAADFAAIAKAAATSMKT